MYRKPALTFVGVLLIAAFLVVLGLGIHQWRVAYKKQASPIAQDNSLVSAPTPRYAQSGSNPTPTPISITDITPPSATPIVETPSAPLPKSGPAESLALILMVAFGALGGVYWVQLRAKWLASARNLDIR